MGRHIKSFSDGSYLEYSEGSFDSWCVYLIAGDGRRRAPRDVEYFTWLKELADNYGADKVYGDFVRVYDPTGKQPKKNVLDMITEIAASYGGAAVKADITFTILYAAMIAEENKQNTRLGKRIKRLAVHMILRENCEIAAAAGCLNGKRYQEIARLCEERGF